MGRLMNRASFEESEEGGERGAASVMERRMNRSPAIYAYAGMAGEPAKQGRLFICRRRSQLSRWGVIVQACLDV